MSSPSPPSDPNDQQLIDLSLIPEPEDEPHRPRAEPQAEDADERAFLAVLHRFELYHINYRHTWRTFYSAVTALPNTAGAPTSDFVVSTALKFLASFRIQKKQEEETLFVRLGRRMPAFRSRRSIPPAQDSGARRRSRGPAETPQAPQSAYGSQLPVAASDGDSRLIQQQHEVLAAAAELETYFRQVQLGQRQAMSRGDLVAEANRFGGMLLRHLEKTEQEVSSERMRHCWTAQEAESLLG